MPRPTSTLGKFGHGLAVLYRGFRAVILNLLFLFIVLVLAGSMIGEPPVVVHRGSALVIDPVGALVDQLTYVNPYDALMADAVGADVRQDEVLLQDLLDAINLAAIDDDIAGIVLLPGELQGSGFSKLQEVGQALLRFREHGKKVYAYADSYSQGQYFLAAHADEVILNPAGTITLEGFSTYQYYYLDALDKLGVNVHVFRVGEYKSAVEPYTRNDMSPEAREANADWIGDLWTQFVDDVTAARGLEQGFLQTFIDDLDQQLAAYAGDAGALLQATGLADSLMNRVEGDAYLRQLFGPGITDSDFLGIGYDSYLGSRGDMLSGAGQGGNQVGIIVASGTIYDGAREAGEIGGDSLQSLIRQAREDDSIKAVVLRIDSPGGSAFASEIIRNELEQLRGDGKPLIVSMGSVAASGGYWIATPANEIWASASTITGSIGIFGLYPTFEETFAKLGLHVDGFGTTELAGAITPGRPLPEKAGNILQLLLEDGYNRFIALVAESRDMPVGDVDAIARGRVWSGADAFNLGLVDHLGDLEQAIAAAADLAGLDEYGTQLIEQRLSPGQQLLQDLAGSSLVARLLPAQPALAPVNALAAFYDNLNDELQTLLKFNDPRGLYLQCQDCLSALSP